MHGIQLALPWVLSCCCRSPRSSGSTRPDARPVASGAAGWPAASASSDVTIDSRGRTLLDAAREATLALAIELQRVGAEVTVVALRSFGRTVLLKASWLLQHRDVLQRIAVDHQQVGIGLRGHRPFGLHTARDTVGLAISASIATAAIPASGIAGPDVLRWWGRVVETVLSR